jgi:hypothetical protein
MNDEIKTRISIIQKEKISIKRIRFKIEIQNKSYIWLNGEIEKKSKFSEMTKKDIKKNEDQNCHKNNNKILIERCNWKKK